MFQFFAILTLLTVGVSFLLTFEAPNSLYLFVPLIVLGVVMFWVGIAIYRNITKNPVSGVGSPAGNGIIALFGLVVAWVGLLSLSSAAIVGWRIWV